MQRDLADVGSRRYLTSPYYLRHAVYGGVCADRLFAFGHLTALPSPVVAYHTGIRSHIRLVKNATPVGERNAGDLRHPVT